MKHVREEMAKHGLKRGEKAIAHVIKTAKARGRKIGICGHAPSDYPEFAQFLVEQGIDSISLNPDAVLKTPVKILEMEQAEPVLFCPHHFQIGANNLCLEKTPPTHFIALDWPFL